MPSPRYAREIPSRYRLEAAACAGCGKILYPARLVCPACGKTEFEPTRLSPHAVSIAIPTVQVGHSHTAMAAGMMRRGRISAAIHNSTGSGHGRDG